MLGEYPPQSALDMLMEELDADKVPTMYGVPVIVGQPWSGAVHAQFVSMNEIIGATQRARAEKLWQVAMEDLFRDEEG